MQLSEQTAGVTLAQVMGALEEEDSRGFCLACGERDFGIEPDGPEHVCESCGQSAVYAAEELFMALL